MLDYSIANRKIRRQKYIWGQRQRRDTVNLKYQFFKFKDIASVERVFVLVLVPKNPYSILTKEFLHTRFCPELHNNKEGFIKS